MNTSAAQLQDDRFGATVLAWPHKQPEIAMTESDVREKVTSVLATEFGLSSGRLQGNTHIKKSLNVKWYELAAPIMTIENFFRTLLQEESANDDLSVDMIVEKLMGRGTQATVH